MDIEQSPDLELGDEVVADDQVDASGDETEADADTEQSEGVDDTPADDESEDKPASKSRHQRRREHMADIQRRLEAATAFKERITAAKTEEPKESEFDDHFEYVAAKAVWKSTQAADTGRAREADDALQHLSQERQAEVVGMFTEACDDARSRYSDFDAVALNPRLPVSPAMQEAILQSDMAADVLYHLGKTPALARQLAGLSPIEVAMSIGRLEGTLAKPRPITQSKAPAPISPVKARGSVSKDPEKMTPDEYRAWRTGGGKF